MTHLVAIILGFVEGATEFIPISSSGHLIIARHLLGVNDAGGLAFDAVIQLATACALLVYFYKDIVRLSVVAWLWLTRKPIEAQEKVLLYSIVLGTIPAVFFGLLLQKKMETVFRNIHLVALMLVFGSLLFLYAEHISKISKNKHKLHGHHGEEDYHPLTLTRGIRIGFYQCLALFPGFSRSGATISGGLIEGLTMGDAVRFSFLLSLPILFGAGFKELFSLRHVLFSTGYGSSLLLGSIVAFITGLVAINFLMKYLKNHTLQVFIWYRIALAVVLFFFF